MTALIFIDANIFLDFYRAPAGNTGLTLLQRINDHHDAIITGDQVEMEFKKNRQGVILDSYNQVIVSGAKFSLPAFLIGSPDERMLKKLKDEMDEHALKIKEGVKGVLRDPVSSDPVYKIAESLFRADTVLSLSRRKSERKKIRLLAEKRFRLGYPPRKPKDTSIGDAINWEWMIACVRATGRDLIIVTRDGDFGVTIGAQSVLNDWLSDEFAERTRGQRVVLTTKLAEAFAAISVEVSKDEVAAEDALIAKRPNAGLIGALAAFEGDDWSSNQLIQMYNKRSREQLAALLAGVAANQPQDELPPPSPPNES